MSQAICSYDCTKGTSAKAKKILTCCQALKLLIRAVNNTDKEIGDFVLKSHTHTLLAQMHMHNKLAH